MTWAMFEYLCKGCDVTGWTKDWPPKARCWNCEKGDELVPASFESRRPQKFRSPPATTST